MTMKLAPLIIEVEVPTKTYEVVTTDRHRYRFTVPATFRITYGAIVPGAKGGFGIRVWESTDKQRLVMAEVASFRDLSIPMEIEAARSFGQDDWYADDGLYPPGTVERAWKPVDEIKERPATDYKDPDEDVLRPSIRKRF